MSHLAREIDRQLVWIEKHADDLMATVKDLSADVRAEMQGPGWDEVQCQAIRLALNNWGITAGVPLCRPKLSCGLFVKSSSTRSVNCERKACVRRCVYRPTGRRKCELRK